MRIMGGNFIGAATTSADISSGTMFANAARRNAVTANKWDTTDLAAKNKSLFSFETFFSYLRNKCNCSYLFVHF